MRSAARVQSRTFGLVAGVSVLTAEPLRRGFDPVAAMGEIRVCKVDAPTRILRAVSGLSRASRDLDTLGEAGDLSAHAKTCVWELSVDVANGVRRLAYVARISGVSPGAIEKAKQR
jgi:hypothetical protein